ncbi:MAG: hypothetical protein M1379_17530 [Firmicutes bacterium]|nr:hypothetical protein [Bacillota bacterium]
MERVATVRFDLENEITFRLHQTSEALRVYIQRESTAAWQLVIYRKIQIGEEDDLADPEKVRKIIHEALLMMHSTARISER